jgi:threonine synthase
MDIQVSSNFERLLFELLGRDGAKTTAIMDQFSSTGQFDVDDDVMARAAALFSAYRLDDAGTIAEIADTAQQTGMVIDPHSAVGLSAARRAHADGTVPTDVPIISLACAHPAKFDQAVETATGATPALPPHMADLMSRPARQQHVPADATAVKNLILSLSRGQ